VPTISQIFSPDFCIFLRLGSPRGHLLVRDIADANLAQEFLREADHVSSKL
jgi:hypothetical protein